jgi:hypothetical protein
MTGYARFLSESDFAEYPPAMSFMKFSKKLAACPKILKGLWGPEECVIWGTTKFLKLLSFYMKNGNPRLPLESGRTPYKIKN